MKPVRVADDCLTDQVMYRELYVSLRNRFYLGIVNYTLLTEREQFLIRRTLRKTDEEWKNFDGGLFVGELLIFVQCEKTSNVLEEVQASLVSEHDGQKVL